MSRHLVFLEHLLVELDEFVVVGVRLGLLVDLTDDVALCLLWLLGVGIQVLVLEVCKKAFRGVLVTLEDLKTIFHLLDRFLKILRPADRFFRFLKQFCTARARYVTLLHRTLRVSG